MRRMMAVFIHTDLLQRLVHPAADLLRRNAEILRGKGDVLLDHIGDHLIVRVLEDHAHRPADVEQEGFVLRVHAEHRDTSALGQKDRVHMLCQRGFAAAVAPQHRHKTPLFDAQIKILKHRHRRFAGLRGIGEAQIFCNDCFTHEITFYFFEVQRPVAPQGSTRPESVTGRPSSSDSVCPPKRGSITVLSRHVSTEGARPVV